MANQEALRGALVAEDSEDLWLHIWVESVSHKSGGMEGGKSSSLFLVESETLQFGVIDEINGDLEESSEPVLELEPG